MNKPPASIPITDRAHLLEDTLRLVLRGIKNKKIPDHTLLLKSKGEKNLRMVALSKFIEDRLK